MRNVSFLLAIALVLSLLLPVAAQDAISAKAGMVNYFEGKVLLNGAELTYERAKFPQIPKGGTLEATMEGRAEVLLAPGVLMWLGEGAKVELVSDSLAHAKVRLLAGSVVVSATEFADDSTLSLLVNEDTVEIRERGIYRLEASPASVYVYDGEANVLRATGDTKVKKGRTLALSQPEASLAKFDKDETSSLLAWAQSRDSQIQLASLSAARSMASGGFINYPVSTFDSMGMLGYWLYNPYFGMYSLVPLNRVMMSPWGSYYYTPRVVTNFYSNYAMGVLQPGGRGSAVPSMSRGGFGANDAGFGGPYSRGASSLGMGGYDGGRALGAMGPGSYSRGASSVGGGGVSGGAPSAPTSSGGASMGRGGESVGRGGGGGRN